VSYQPGHLFAGPAGEWRGLEQSRCPGEQRTSDHELQSEDIQCNILYR